MDRTKTRVRGDWLAEDHPGYEAEVDAVRWNGWAVPHFTEEVARQVVADQKATNADLIRTGHVLGDLDTLDIVVEAPLTIRHGFGDDGDFEDIAADPDGLFAIGGWSWCWYEADHYA